MGDLYEKDVSTGQETKRYFLGDTLVATAVVGGPPSSTYQDYLHSTVSASNGSSVEYTPYGLVKASSSSLPTDRQFQGQQNQSSVGLYQMGDRWYDPAIGIWTQPDSIVPNVLDPLSLNHFAFVEGNPLRFTDPSGHSVADPNCQDGNTCTSPSDVSLNTTGTSSGNQQPPDDQSPCAIFVCVAVGNYAVQVIVCTPAGCISWIVPVGGAIPPPESSNGEDPPDDSVKLDPGAEMLKASTGTNGDGVSTGGAVQKFRGPAAKGFDWEHILDRHSDSGDIAIQRSARGKGTVFQGLSDSQIKARVQGAWRNRELMQTQTDPNGGTRMRYRGVDPASGQTIEMWYNRDTGIVESAYPIIP